MHDAREGVHRFAVQQHVHTDELRLLEPVRFVIEAREPAGLRLQLIEEVEHDLCQRQDVVDLHALGREVAHVDHLAAP